MRSRLPLLAALALASHASLACGDGGATAPDADGISVAVQAGGDQSVGPGSTTPLQVVVKGVTRSAPVRGVRVTWTVTGGTGASVSPATSVTDSTGVATTMLTVGSQPGAYQVEATAPDMVGPAPRFTVTVVADVAITAIAPASARGGDTVTITGRGFGTGPTDNTVLFGGIAGTVAAAAPTSLRVVVPACLPAGTVPVQVIVGTLSSGTLPLAVSAGAGTAGPVAVGQVVGVVTPAALGCVQLAGGQAGASYLVVVQNASTLAGQSFTFQLRGVAAGTVAGAPAPGAAGAGAVAAAPALPSPGESFASGWEARLRERERALLRGGALGAPEAGVAGAGAAACAGEVSVGARCAFNVYNVRDEFSRVTAVVRAVSTRAIIYEDTAAPAGGFTEEEYREFARRFDDPIYGTDVAVYGGPSDLDANGRVVILFTPVVNELTPRGSNGFVAGFFYGCDLVTARDCAGTNRGEIFYALVPDPTGRHGITQSKMRVQQSVPPVLAHEFQHMIHFNQRVLVRGARSEEALWLSEALAHAAEDTVGGVYLQRGDSASALLFKAPNFHLAFDYLRDPSATPLLATSEGGTLEERGAGWLFVKYLMGRFGGGVLGRLTQTTRSSADNVSSTTGTQWPVLFNDWTVALWADDAPEPANVDRRYTYPNFDLRRVLGQPALGGVYPLRPAPVAFGDFTVGRTLGASSAAYYLVQASASSPSSLGLVLTAAGGAFPPGSAAQLAILRVR